MSSFLKFWREPLNQAALASMAGTALAMLNGSLSWQHAAPIAVGALVALVVPDNSLAVQDIEQIVADAIKAAGDIKPAAK